VVFGTTGELHAKYHVYQGNVSPLQGEKPLSKRSTGMAALRCAQAFR